MPNERPGPPGPRLADLAVRHVDRILVIERACFPAPWTRGQFEREFSIGRGTLRGAFCPETDRLDGYLIAWPVAGEVHLMNLAVHPARQRQGWGAALLDDLLGRAVQEGWAPVWLEVRPGNRAALALYASRGFIRAGRRPGYYEDTGEDALLLRWK
ncbi:MAG: ribosomal protein S18-alanine N-acetyltransferase [Proteobacteria bacterium]|nr:ribosomal protein S18-alanine N-acetyltransferase [Pseudomonadota bacterium]MBU1741624.1 ribosomal protein S18-alanine N-acetyltransferase [Pseudomonadota bacterium]